MKSLYVLFVFACAAFAADGVLTPLAKTLPVGSGEVEFRVETEWVKTNTGVLRTNFGMTSFSFAPKYGLEVMGEYSYGATSGVGYKSLKYTVANPGPVGAGVRYRLWRQSYEGGEAIATVGYKYERGNNSTNDFTQKLDLNAFRAGYVKLGEGQVHRGNLQLFTSRNRLIWGGFGEFAYRPPTAGLKLGNEYRAGGMLYYALFDVKHRQNVAVIFDSYWRHINRGSYAISYSQTGANELAVAPGIVFNLSPRLALKASWAQPVRYSLGDYIPGMKRGVIVALNYRFN